MKKNMIKAVVLAAFAVVTGYNVHEAQTKVELSDTQMKNVEALATGEATGPDRPDCEKATDERCVNLVVYPNGIFGEDVLLDHKKKAGWL